MPERRTLTRAARVRIFDRHCGLCHLCGLKIHAERGELWDVEHVKPLWLGGEDDEKNMRPAHKHCHAIKSAAESPERSKGTRIRARHLGIKRKRASFRTNRDAPYKKRMDGTVVRRDR